MMIIETVSFSSFRSRLPIPRTVAWMEPPIKFMLKLKPRWGDIMNWGLQEAIIRLWQLHPGEWISALLTD